MFTQLSSLGGSATLIPFPSYGMGDVCKSCGKTDFVNDTVTGDRICTFCGNVQLQNMLSEEPEWRAYKEEGRTHSIRSNFQAMPTTMQESTPYRTRLFLRILCPPISF